MPEIPTEGLPPADRLRLRVANPILGGLSPMAVIRLAHHLPRRVRR